MKSTKSRKPAKPSFGRGNSASAASALVLICIVGLVMFVAARRAPNTAEAPVMAAQLQKVAAPARTNARPAPAKPTAQNTMPKPNPRPEPVTITGCLEREDDRFRLTETDLVTEPTGRSWKSGFLKKGTSAIDVVDDSNRLKLASHVGARVSVTGTLAYREIQGHSVRRVAASCK